MTIDPARRLRLVLMIAFVAALGFTAFHIVRTVTTAIYWQQHRDEPIERWMTIGYVAHSYHVPPHVLLMAIGLPPTPPDHRTLKAIARAQSRSVDDLTSKLQITIVHARPPYPPPAPPPRVKP